MTLLSELVAELQSILSREGDMPCVTRGFDEAGLGDVEVLEVQWHVRDRNPAGSHQGAHDESTAGAPNAEKCLLIN